jgi:hypothetical protein
MRFKDPATVVVDTATMFSIRGDYFTYIWNFFSIVIYSKINVWLEFSLLLQEGRFRILSM